MAVCASEDDGALPPACPQLVDSRIDLIAHVLLQELSDQPGSLTLGIKQSAIALLQMERPLTVLLTTDAGGAAKDAVMANLATMCGAIGVPVIYTLSRQHMGRACRSSWPVSAVAIHAVRGDRARMLLGAMTERAAAAVSGWLAAAAHAGAAACMAPRAGPD